MAKKEETWNDVLRSLTWRVRSTVTNVGLAQCLAEMKRPGVTAQTKEALERLRDAITKGVEREFPIDGD